MYLHISEKYTTSIANQQRIEEKKKFNVKNYIVIKMDERKKKKKEKNHKDNIKDSWAKEARIMNFKSC